MPSINDANDLLCQSAASKILSRFLCGASSSLTDFWRLKSKPFFFVIAAMQLNGCDVERQTADPTEIDAPLVRSAVENGREPLIDNLGEQDAMKKVTDVVAKQSSESAAELEEFFRGKQLERRLHQPSPVRLEYFKRNGSWSMFVEEIVATQYDGKWRVSQTDDGRAIICVIRLKKDSQPITNSTEECRDVRISKDDGILSISMPGHRSLVSDYDFSEL